MKPKQLLLLTVCFTSLLSAAADFKWTGLRVPPKVSADDGVTALGTKIGKFTTLTKEEVLTSVRTVNGKFSNSRPWATWAVGPLPDATEMSDEKQYEYLSLMDSSGVDVFLEIYPRKTNDVAMLIDTWLGKFKQHKSVKGFGIDLEYYKKVDDIMAKAWDEKIKAHNPNYRMFLKHWEEAFMPPSYRGKGDLIFICTSSEETVDNLNAAFTKWAAHFAPSACAFQLGYPADEDGMDGKNDKGWWKLADPIKDWGASLANKIENPKQELGLLWVCVKSGKTYNTKWDLTKISAPTRTQ